MQGRESNVDGSPTLSRATYLASKSGRQSGIQADAHEQQQKSTVLKGSFCIEHKAVHGLVTIGYKRNESSFTIHQSRVSYATIATKFHKSHKHQLSLNAYQHQTPNKFYVPNKSSLPPRTSQCHHRYPLPVQPVAAPSDPVR